MEIRIKPTDQVTRIDGVECRVWEGTTGRGIKCHVFVHRIAVHLSQSAEEFERELTECIPPRPRHVPLEGILL